MITTEAPPAVLSEGVVVNFLRAVNTELKGWVLNSIPEDGISQAQLTAAVREGVLLPPTGKPMDARHPGRIALTFPEGMVETESSSEGRIFYRTLAGAMAAGLGGQLLHLSYAANKSIRTFAGEDNPPRLLPGKSPAAGALETRLAVLRNAVGYVTPFWRHNQPLFRAVQTTGATEGTVRKHIEKLKKAHLVDTRVDYRSGLARGEIKWSRDTYYPPEELLGRYVAIIDSFAAVDKDMLVEGHALFQRLAADPVKKQALLQRSFVASPHTGKVCAKP
jgi:DNA-binding transcriptional ArsR family regulator